MKRHEVGIGIVGYGMMGRAHAYGVHRRAERTRAAGTAPAPGDQRTRPGRGREGRRALRSRELDDRLAGTRRAAGHPDRRHLHAAGSSCRDRHRRRGRRQGRVCEKPLGRRLRRRPPRAVEAVRAAGVPNAIGFNYRRLPAVSLLKRLVDEGRIGEVLLWRASWLSDEFLDPDIPFDWRFERRDGRHDDRRPRRPRHRPRALDRRRDRGGERASSTFTPAAERPRRRDRRGLLGPRPLRRRSRRELRARPHLRSPALRLLGSRSTARAARCASSTRG